MKFALRSLLKSPGFTSATVLTLALGIGATTAIFSVLYAVLLRPFAYPDADQLVVLWQKGSQMEMSISWPTIQDWMKEQKTFTALAAHRRDSFNLSGAGQLPENVIGAYASASLFEVAGLKPVLGRYYTAEEDKAGADPVVVINEDLWARRYGRNPALVGSTIPVDGVQRTVLGIAPASLSLPRRAEMWVPIFPYAATKQNWQSRGNNPGLYSTGRMKPGVTLEQVKADMERIYVGLRQAYPDNLAKVSAIVHAFRENQIGQFSAGLWSLLAATGFVLLIACANVASLFITRGISQERDYAVRAALGASRGQLMRHMLTESLLISLTGGVCAMVFAWWSLGLIRRFVPADVARFQGIELNGWVLGFSVLVAVGSGVLAGLWPALRTSRADVRDALHDGGRGSTGGSASRRFLVGAQVALTLVLLSVSGLILRSLDRMRSADLGFDASSTLQFNLSLPASRYDDKSRTGEAARRFYLNLDERLRNLPGVLQVALSTTPPLNAGWQSSFAAEGIHDPAGKDKPLSEMGIVNDDYFATLKIPLLRGRVFNAQDETGPKVVIVDQGFVDKFWPGQDPLGKRINWGGVDAKDPNANWYTIIGVVPTVRVYGYDEPITRPQAYWSLRQGAWLQKVVLLRTATSPRLLERAVRELVASLDGEIAVFNVTTMQEEVESTYANTSLQSFLLSLFAGLALLLALTGLYSVVAYGVTMRRREIGVRMALGAMPRDVIQLMVRQGLIPLAAGVAVGLLGAIGAGFAIRSQLYEVSAADPLILTATTLLLALAATLACWWPARKAATVNPTVALRAE
ncbi:MAG TPA: ABC transporter permease [Lacunisphaera sp.]|nr:ABC transporter permease [Lacunisphaera sp.]